jgi:polar amino acid transport system substrate-binding protein
MKIPVLLVALAFGHVIQSTSSVAAEKMTLRADLWCPYNCEPKGKDGEGFLVDMMREIFKDTEYQIDYEIAPWTHAVAQTRTGKFNGVIAVADTDSVGLVHTEKAQIISVTCAYGLRSSQKSIKRAEDLRQFKSIGSSKDYSYGAHADEVLRDPKMRAKVFPLGGENPLGANIRKVLDGKIEVVLEDVNVMEYQIATMGLDKIKNLGCTEDRVNLWIGFTDPKINPRSKSWVEALDKGQARLEASGKLSEIYKKYNISPR